MKWFKHASRAFDDERLSAAFDRLGMEGYGFWWRTLEVAAAKSDGTGRARCAFSPKKWGALFGFSARKFEKFARIFAELGLLDVEFEDGLISVCVPDLLEYGDEWSRRKARGSGAAPAFLRSEDKEEEKRDESPLGPRAGARGTPRAPGSGFGGDGSADSVGGSARSVSTAAPPVLEERFPDVAFLQFAESYPTRKRDEGAAWRVWLALSKTKELPGLPRLFDALSAWEKSEQWTKADGRYVPLLSTFLAKRRFLDVPPPPAGAKPFDAARFEEAAARWTGRWEEER